MNKNHENINNYIPNTSSVGSKNAQVYITRNNKINNTSFRVPGIHSAESCALNAGIYAANTAYSENALIHDGKTITAKDGLAFTIYNKSQLVQDGISTSWSNFNSALPGIEALSSYTTINWVGYFYVSTTDPCTFVGRNISMWIGDYAFRLYNNSNTNLSKTKTSYTYTPQKTNTYIPIRLQYTNDKSNDFTFSCKQDTIKPTFSFVTLYKGCDVYYTNQVLYSIVKNRSTPSKYANTNNYFDCTIYGKNTNGSINLPANQVVSDSKSKPTDKQISNTVLNGNPSIPYTNYKDNQIALNISMANLKMGKMYKDDTNLISDNDPSFNYIGTNITYNNYKQTYPLSNDGKNRKDLTSCMTNCTNDSSCKGFYYGENMNGYSTCNNINNEKNITYLPQQPNQTSYKSSTLYTKNPKANNTNTDICFNVINTIELFSSSVVEGLDNTPIISNTPTPTTWQPSTNQSQNIQQDPIVDQPIMAATAATIFNPNNKPSNPLLLHYTLNSNKNTNSVTTPGYDSKAISISPTLSTLNNGMTVSKSTYNHSIQLPSFNKLASSIIINNDLTPVSLSIHFKPGLVTTKAHQVWRIFDFNGRDTYFQLYIICDRKKVTTLYCKSKVQGAPQSQDFAVDIQNLCSMNSWNNIVVVFYKEQIQLYLNQKEIPINRTIFMPRFYEFTSNSIGSNIITKEGFTDAKPVSDWEKDRKVGVAEAKAQIIEAQKVIINKYYENLRKRYYQQQKNQSNNKNQSNKIKMPNINFNNYIEEADDFTIKIRGLIANVAQKAANEIKAIIDAILNFLKNILRGGQKPSPPHYNDTVLFYDFRLYNVDICMPDSNGKTIMSTIANLPSLENFSNININQDMQSFSFNTPCYSIIEGFTNLTGPQVLKEMGQNAQANINEANNLLPNYSSYLHNIVSKQIDLSRNITNYNITRDKVYDIKNTNNINNGDQGVVYSFDSNGNIIPNTIDSTGKIVSGKNSTTRDVIKNDLDTLIVQQNTIYITGTVACATLLIAAIIIGSK